MRSRRASSVAGASALSGSATQSRYASRRSVAQKGRSSSHSPRGALADPMRDESAPRSCLPVHLGSAHRASIPAMRAVLVALAVALAAPTAISATRPAPSLEGVDARTGRHISLADYAGRRVVINVWGSWCSECVLESADLKRFAATPRGGQVLGLHTHAPKHGAKRVVAPSEED